jgi:hypothetical protein
MYNKQTIGENMTVKTTTTWISLENKKQEPPQKHRINWLTEQVTLGKLLTPINEQSDDLIVTQTWVDQAAVDSYLAYMQRSLGIFQIPSPTITVESV